MTGSLKPALLSAVGLLFPLTGLADTYVGKVLDETGSPLTGAVVRIEGHGGKTQ